MASKKRNKRQTSRPPRDALATRYRQVRAVERLLTPVSHYLGLVTQLREAQRRHASPLGDRRRWHPERWGQPLVASNRAATRVVVKNAPGPVLPSRLTFADPRKLDVCQRRQTRKEVIHALGKAGGGNRAPRRKPSSEISC